MKRNSKRQNRKQSPKEDKPNEQEETKEILFKMFGFDINNNQDLQNLNLQQSLLDAMVEKGFATDGQFFQACF